jgi:hypothetical protein
VDLTTQQKLKNKSENVESRQDSPAEIGKKVKEVIG